MIKFLSALKGSIVTIITISGHTLNVINNVQWQQYIRISVSTETFT